MYVCMYVCMTVLETTAIQIQTCFKGESKSVLLRHLNIGCLPSATCVCFSNSRSKDQRVPSLAHALLPRETQ